MIEGPWSIVLRRILKQHLGLARSSAIMDRVKHSGTIEMKHGSTHLPHLSSSRTEESNS